MSNISIVGIIGSLRKNSYNRSLMNAVKELAPDGVTFEIAEIGEIPLYNQDVEAAAFPVVVQALKDKIMAADGVIIATPEYLRSIPGVLKNTLDWTSRPSGKGAWGGKTVGVVGATGGAIGTAVAQSHLKQILLDLGARVMGQPEFFLGEVTKKLDAEGLLVDASTKEHIGKFWDAFIKDVARR